MRNPLLTLFAAMQTQAARYIEPTPHYQPFSSNAAEWAEGETPTEAQRQCAFINDMIYMLDGPEQREAQAHAEFDYLSESARTAAGTFYGVNARRRLVLQKLATFVEAGEALDRYKKLFFYGEDHAKKRYADPINSEGNGGHIIESIMSSAEGVSQDDAEYLLHAVLGIATEAGEMVEALLNGIAAGRPLDPVNLSEEAGDLLWYLAMLLRVLHVDFDSVMRQNIKKLKDRFPDKFTTEAANNRNLESERRVLEGASTEGSPQRKFFGQQEHTEVLRDAGVPSEGDGGEHGVIMDAIFSRN